MSDGCPICGSNDEHEHIISKALPQGNHSTYEELAAENVRIHKVKDTVLRERQVMEMRCREMNGDIEDLKRWNTEMRESLIAILTCASSGGPNDVPFDLGLIRIECRRVLGHPGSQVVDKLSDTFGSTEDILESFRDYMNKHSDATGSGPCCPPGRCKHGVSPLECLRWKETP